MALPSPVTFAHLDEATDIPSLARAEIHGFGQAINQLITHLGLPGGSAFIGEGKILFYVPNPMPDGWLECQGQSLSRSTYSALFAKIGIAFGSADAQSFNLPDCRRRTLVGRGGTGTSDLANTVGATGGAESVTLTSNQMPSHTHSVTVSATGSHSHGGGSLATSFGGGHRHNVVYSSPSQATSTPQTQLGAENKNVITRAGEISAGSGSWYDLRGTDNGANAGRSSFDIGHSHTISGTTGTSGSHGHSGTAASTGGGQAHSNLQPSIVVVFLIYTGVTN